MRYKVYSAGLVNGNVVTVYRGDIIAGFDPDPGAVLILRIQKNERTF